jgi:5-methylcytosine-specific restriction endonuclease McrA
MPKNLKITDELRLISKAERFTDDEARIMDFYGWRCIRCRKTPAILHEIIPRSQYKDALKDSSNRVPLCPACHTWAHHRGTKNSREELYQLRDGYIERRCRGQEDLTPCQGGDECP